ncbi:MAG: putative zinc-binding metallopeptidase [Bacteroidales bacterium]|nr:putative zinc-binding metallopeptidase [Bacteroidales bacterium]
MKKYIAYILLLGVAAFTLAACQEDLMQEESVIKDSAVEKNAFDEWLETNFLKPYNIDFKYRFELNESDLGYYTVPADYNASIIYAHLVKYLCIDTYDEVAGVDFTRGYFPKMFFLIGEWEYRNNGSFVLGTAEGGKKIMLSGVNYLPQYFARLSGDELSEVINYYYIKTIHHEFTHILNQNKLFSDSFKSITASTYVADAAFDTDDLYQQRGYITAYAQTNPDEDFAELLSEYVTHDQAWWEEQLANGSADGADGGALMTAKMDIVRDYMQNSWNINLDELRATVLRRTADVSAGKVDLTDISIK